MAENLSDDERFYLVYGTWHCSLDGKSYKRWAVCYQPKPYSDTWTLMDTNETIKDVENIVDLKEVDRLLGIDNG